MGSLFGNIQKNNTGTGENTAPVEPTPVPVENTQEQAAIPPAAPAPESGGVFDISAQKQDQAGGLMENIIQQKDQAADQGSLLDTSSLKKFKQFSGATGFKEHHYYTVVKAALGLVVILALGINIFFYTQLSPSFTLFGVNTSTNWKTSLDEVQIAHNKVVRKKLTLAKMHLDTIADRIDNYFKTAEQSKRNVLKTEITDLYKNIKSELNFEVVPLALAGQYDNELDTKQTYQQAFISQIDREISDIRSEFSNETGTETQQKEAKIDIQVLETVKKIYQQKPLRTNFLSITLDEKNFDEGLRQIFTHINDLSESNYSLIAQIQTNRIDWADTINRIRAITRQVDPHHASEKWKSLSSIIYTSLSLSDEKISIAGSVKTKDSKNFTKIADLIDLFEASDEFENATSRSFAKSYNPQTKEYQSSLQINFNFQKPDDTTDSESSNN